MRHNESMVGTRCSGSAFMHRSPQLAVGVALFALLGVLAPAGLGSHAGGPTPTPLLSESEQVSKIIGIVPIGRSGSEDTGLSSSPSHSPLASGQCGSEVWRRGACDNLTGFIPGLTVGTSEGWVQVQPNRSPPLNASEYDEAVYDAATNSTIMFQIACGVTLCHSPQTWTFSGGNWTLLHVAGPPGGRASPSLIYDAADRYVVLYGGQSWNSTWKFSDGNWTNLTESLSPGALDGAEMVYDAYDGYVLLYGGYNDTGLGTPNETWAFEDGTWTQLTSTGSAPPVNVGYSGNNPMVFDPILQSVVYFADSNETYLFHGGNWKAIHAPIPDSLQGGGSLAYDPLSGLVLYIGGNDGLGFTNQTYGFNGTAWTTLHPARLPPGSVSPCLVYDPSVRGILFFGGALGDGNNQTWVFGAGNVSFQASPPDGGNFNVAGTIYDSGGSDWVPFGSGLPTLAPNIGFHGTNLTIGGNYTLHNGSSQLSGNATVFGMFQAFPTVSLVSEPPECEIGFNGTLYPSGSSPFFASGSFALDAPNCGGVHFDRWVSTSNASIVNPTSNRTTITLAGSAGVTAAYFAILTFQVNPPFEGTLLINGSAVTLDTPQDWVAQNYSLQGIPAPGWRLSDFTISGGVTVVGNEAVVLSSGSVQANFVPFPTVVFASSLTSCTSILFNGTTYTSGDHSEFLLGNYPLRAPGCSDAIFQLWTASGSVSVSPLTTMNATADVTGNGTLTANYGAAAWVNVSVQPSAAAGSITWNGTPVRNGSHFEALTGDYPVTAQPANGWHFLAWETQGGIRLVPGSFALNWNASLTAEFQVNASSNGGNQSDGSGFGLTAWEWVAVGALLVGVVALAIVLLRRRFKTEPTSDPS
jgi:Galactose oxidase, central domain/Divergent InlB B-repeat domain